MIFGHVNDLEPSFAWLPKPLRTALEHLRDTDFTNLPAGKYDLQGRDIYVQVIDMKTKLMSESRAEVHRQYIDVQFLFSGAEKVGFAAETGRNLMAEDLLAERDLIFYTGMENESTITMVPGNFAMFFPRDVHRPGVAVDQPMAIRKVVVKVRESLLENRA